MSTEAPIVIMAGGTGGHVFPALAVAEQLRAQGVSVKWMGSQRGLETKLVPQAGIPMESIAVAGLRGQGPKRLLAAPFMIARALLQAAAIFRRLKPRLVLGMGGFVSGPGGLMAWCLRIPLVVHEQNALVGGTNRWLSRIADQVLEAFPGSFPPSLSALTVGNPVRESIAALPEPARRFSRPGNRSHLLVIGGSQGALILNQITPQALALLLPSERPEVWHQAGSQLQKSAAQSYQKAGVEVCLEPFIEDMAKAYGWADLVLCRAGAITVTELAAAGVGAVLVPFPHAVDDHQTANAQFLVRRGAALIIQQTELTAERLASVLRELLGDRERLLTMAQAARRLAQADAAKQVARVCLECAR